MKQKIQKLLITIVSIFSMNITNIHANSNITCKVTLYRNTSDGLQEIPKGFDFKNLHDKETIRLRYDIKNTGEPVTINIHFPTGKGIEIIPLTSTERILLTDSLSLEVDASIHKDASIITSQIVIEATHSNEEITSHAFSFQHKTKYSMNNKEKEHTVNFYGMNNKLLSTQKITNNQVAKVPSYTVPGYQIVGFNTKRDGSGMYYNNTTITGNQNFYAIYKALVYTVYYHVDNEVYQTKEVTYDSDTIYIEAPSKKNKNFIGWYGQLTNVKEDIHVYAIYKDTDNNYYLDERLLSEEETEIVKDYEVSSTKIEDYEGRTRSSTSSLKNTDEQYMFINDQEEIQYVDTVIEVPDTSTKIPWSLVFILSSLLSLYSGYIFIKRRKKIRN
jgi:hypothetical protein